MKTCKKTLLILFGELRTFEHAIPSLNRLNDVDIVLSTWSESKRHDSTFLVNSSMIFNILPIIKQIHVTDLNDIPNHENRGNSWKMYWHWKNAINNLNNPDDYENVIVHRCDLISNWHTILNLDIEDDTIYVHRGINQHFKENLDAFWINDYYFFGKFNIVKKFINLFNKDTYYTPHLPIWEVISEHNIKIKNHILHGFIVKDCDIENTIIKTNMINHLAALTGPA
jgi:hypothetical protein